MGGGLRPATRERLPDLELHVGDYGGNAGEGSLSSIYCWSVAGSMGEKTGRMLNW
jgi:hypothetical protein